VSDFTPGPWSYEAPEYLDDEALIDSDRDGVIASMWTSGNRDANARLIAQSPAMYTLLRDLGGDGGDGFCEGCGRDIKSGQEHSPSCRINAILRAVEGRDE
jgi:hypothetical protein